MAKAKATKNSADIGFEKQLWDAADVLRGNMDAADYKNVVLGLIFLKYLSDRFDERYQGWWPKATGTKKIVIATSRKTSSMFPRRLAGLK